MKKVTVFGYWFYNLGALILEAAGIVNIVFAIIGIITQPNEKILPYYLAFSVLGTIFLTFLCLCLLFQYTIISEDGIKTRAICRTIRKLKWDEVKEVRYEKFYVSVEGAFTSGWYVIDDGVERMQRNGLVTKKNHIGMPATKRARKALETFWHGPIIEKEIKQIDT